MFTISELLQVAIIGFMIFGAGFLTACLMDRVRKQN